MANDARNMLAVIAWLTKQRPELIREARKQGSTWEEVATLLGMSVMGVRNLSKK